MFARTSNGQTDKRTNGQTPTIVKPQSGFTMVEMVAVVLILSILIGISSTAISGARRTAMRTHSRDTARQIANAWTAYVTDQSCFPNENKFTGAVGDLLPANPHNIGALLNTQYMADGKTPYSGSMVYYDTSETEVERSGSASNYSYKGTGVLDRFKNVIYFILDFDLRGQVKNPINSEMITASAVGVSTAGYTLNDKNKYGSKFLLAW